MENTYNGWNNYETWNIALHIDNDQDQFRYWGKAATRCLEAAEAKINKLHIVTQTAIKDGELTRIGKDELIQEEAIAGLVKLLEPQYKRGTPKSQAVKDRRAGTNVALLVRSDLLKDELERVNWREVAEHLLETAREYREHGSKF